MEARIAAAPARGAGNRAPRRGPRRGLLRELGYTIVGRQVAVSYGVQIDGEPVSVGLRADYLVAHGPRRYVAEVKTGRLAPRIDTPATRRQLLEYRVAFDVDGVLLVDAESRRVRSVVFPLPAGAAAASPYGAPSRGSWRRSWGPRRGDGRALRAVTRARGGPERGSRRGRGAAREAH